jgi:hypothetical protein
MARQISVQVADDHLKKLATTRKAVDALSEIVWNSLDADALNVTVILVENGLGGIDRIVVKDDGSGFSPLELDCAFTNLGDSWKRQANRTRFTGRLLHGKEGQGRFKGLSLGLNVSWRTTWRDPTTEELRSHIISMNRDNPKVASIEEIQDHFPAPGTVVTISDVDRRSSSFTDADNQERFSDTFSLYLLEYPSVSIRYLGETVDPQSQICFKQEYDSSFDYDGTSYPCSLTVIEWSTQKQRALMLCGSDGFTMNRVPARIQAPGFSFTAYLKSDFLRKINDEGFLDVEELHPGLNDLLGQTREVLRSHFRQRLASLATSKVDEWKQNDIYPYRDEPTDEISKSERQVFDILALNVSEFSPGFNSSDAKIQALSFRLLREAVEESPDAAQRIIAEVLDLPEEKREQLAKLLDKTSLSAIINASKEVTDRLDFIRGLEVLVFEEISKQTVLERKHLHRILAKHTWLFGEEFGLSVDDQSLNAVLEKHIALLEREEEDHSDVTRLDGSHGIVDLMLSRRIPQTRPEEREHLVIELKRPSQKLTEKVVSQIRSYAFAVAEDERFRDTRTTWHFMAVCNEMDGAVQRIARSRDRPYGLIHDDPDLNLKIWVKTWAQVLEPCRGRLHFYQQSLEYEAGRDDALSYLNELYADYLPESLHTVRAP